MNTLKELLGTLPDEDLEQVIKDATTILEGRRATPPQVVMARLYLVGPGAWAKQVTGYSSAQGNAFGILGDWLDFQGSNHERPLQLGTYVAIGGASGEQPRQKVFISGVQDLHGSLYALLRVKRGERFTLHCGPYHFAGQHLGLVASSQAQIDQERAIAARPSLAAAAGKPIFPVLAALAELFRDTPELAPAQPDYSQRGAGRRRRARG